MMSSTRLKGDYALRFSILNHTTTWEDMSETLTRLEDAGRTLLEEARA